MTALLGTNLSSAVVPWDTADVYPSHKAIYGLGGYRSVGDMTARDAIPAARREAGMEVCCTDTYNVYRLNADLTTWKKIADGVISAAGGSVLAGYGVPSVLEPAGVVYARTDAAGLYTSHPTTSGAPAVVQSALDIHVSSIPGSVTLPGAPTTGNLIIAHVSFRDGTAAPPTINTASWTLIDQDLNGSNAASFRLYRYAQVGDTAALPAFCTAGSDYWAAMVWEISGVTGTFATDVESHYASHEAGSASLTVDQLANTGIGDLALVCFGQYDGASNITLAGSQWTTDQTGNNATHFGAMIGAHASVISVGTVSAAATFPSSSQFATASMIIVKTSGTASQSWTLESSPSAANPTATASDTAVNGSALTFMRSDAAPAIQKASSSQFGLVKVDGSTITASGGVISAAGSSPTGANPTATASDTAVNGSAATFMRSDAAPAIQKATTGQFGLVKPDGTSITISGGVITAVGSGGGGYSAGSVPTVVQVAHATSSVNSVTFSSAPTNGNLLVAMCFNATGNTAGSGWTKVIENASGTDWGDILIKVAGAGESATQAPMNVSTSSGGAVIWELHGANATPFVAGASQNEGSDSRNAPILYPNVINCIGLSSCSVVTGGTISTIFNAGTQDVLDNTGNRRMAASHTDLSQTPMAGLLVNFGGGSSFKGATCLITS